MTEIPRIMTAEPVIHGVLKIQWDDGYAGIVDLRPVIARGRIFTYLQEPKNFEKLKIGEHGHGIVWVNDAGEEIDLAPIRFASEPRNRQSSIAPPADRA
jgi:uncharacterized protein DUF2442